MIKLALLGSTGSIGKAALEVVDQLKKCGEEVEVVGLAAGKNVALLSEQIRLYAPKLVSVAGFLERDELKNAFPQLEILVGNEGNCQIAGLDEATVVISAITGTAGLAPTMAAIQKGKRVGLANKESLVAAGTLMMEAVKKSRAEIIPVDSEHSAIFQCLQAGRKEEISRLILTSSGGPFRQFTKKELEKATLDEALQHPTWSMGPKITVDSSTLMNKGLEVIEAHFLFSVPYEQIEVVVHKESIVHSMVEFSDHSMIAQLSFPTMKGPIQYALTYPRRMPSLVPKFDFIKASHLEFLQPDVEKFRCLGLCFEAAKIGRSAPCFLNAANESLVSRFLKKEIRWLEIGEKLDRLLTHYVPEPLFSLEEVLSVDKKARRLADAI